MYYLLVHFVVSQSVNQLKRQVSLCLLIAVGTIEETKNIIKVLHNRYQGLNQKIIEQSSLTKCKLN